MQLKLIHLAIACALLGAGAVQAAETQQAPPVYGQSAAPTLVTLRPAHPRLLFTPEATASLRARMATDPLLPKFIESLRQRSDKAAADGPVPYVTVKFEEFGMQMLEVSRAILARVALHGVMYRLTGDKVYADRLHKEVETALGYPTWNPAHMLDASEMLLAVSLAYDWAYDTWTPEERARIRATMKERTIKRGLEIYDNPTGLSSFFVTTSSNWNAVPNVSLLAGALALAEDEPEMAAKVLKNATISLGHHKQSYEPDGSSDEGPTYWGYGADFYTLGSQLLETALGTEAGMLDSRGLSRSALYRLHAQSPTGRNFSYADCWPRSGPSLGYAILSSRFGPAPARQHLRQLLEEDLGKNNYDSGQRLNPLIALFLPPPHPAEAFNGVPLDATFDGIVQLSMMRSAWNDPRAAYVGFKMGHVEHSHNHLDAGSFVFDQAGVRWSTDLGPEAYTVPGYFRKETNEHYKLTPENSDQPNRWSYLRTTNYGHSTLTLGGDLMARDAVAPMIAHGSNAARAFTVADLTSAYPQRSNSWKRGVALVDRSWLAVRDELAGLKPGVTVDWNLMTESEVKVSKDGRSATLTAKGETMQLNVVRAPAGARLSTAPALPKTAQENQNKGVNRVVLHWVADQPDAAIEVQLVPTSFKGKAAPQAVLRDWR